MNRAYNAAPLLDGYGASGPFYDHTYMGYDRAPHQATYLPAQPLGPYLQGMKPESLMELPDAIPDDGLSSDDEDDADSMVAYGHVDLQLTLGQQLAVWNHRTPDTVAIFTPIPGDTLATAISFARSTLRCDPAVDSALILVPGNRRPVEPTTLYSVKPGSSILLVPKYDYVVIVEVSQLDQKLEVVVNLTMTVRSLKNRLHKDRGFHVDRTDLLFKDEPMENQRHLFDYRIDHGSTIFAMLHLVYDVKVTVETFWGKRYELYVDPCMTTAGMLNAVMRRTVTAQAGDTASFYHLTLPRHALVMYTESGDAMKWNGCLGLYHLADGSVFSLSTIALAHQMSLQTVPVLMHDGKVHNFRLSKLDYWAVLALKVHGMTGFPVNLIRFFRGKRELDLARAVGNVSRSSPAVLLDMTLVNADDDVRNGVDFSFRLGNDVVEVVCCSPARSVRSIKSILEDLGVPNASAYDLVVDGYRLPNHRRIGDVVEEHRKLIDLKLRQYPVFVHAPKGVIYKMNVHAQEALKMFRTRVEMKTGLSQGDYYMLMAGLPVPESESTPVFMSPLAINCSVFLVPVKHKQTFLVVCDDWLVKLRLPFSPSPSEVKHVLWKDRNVPEGSLASVGNFMQWYFAVKASSKGLLHDVLKETEQKVSKPRKSRPRKRRDRGEAELQKYNSMQIRQLQKQLEKRYPDQQNPPARHYDGARKEREKASLYFATRNNGRLHRLDPEDLAEGHLRTYSLPPDRPARGDPELLGMHRHHSAIPDLAMKRGRGQLKRKEPQWMDSLRRLSREEKLEPALASLGNRRKHKTKQRWG